eukprot:2570862-Rhodomonas_salina.2
MWGIMVPGVATGCQRPGSQPDLLQPRSLWYATLSAYARPSVSQTTRQTTSSLPTLRIKKVLRPDYLRSYASPTRCPVLTSRVLLPGSEYYTIEILDLKDKTLLSDSLVSLLSAYARAIYVMSGTGKTYGAML